MTDTTGDIYYSGQICRGSVALGTGCGKCEKCKAEAEVKKEQLYICDKAGPGCECMGLHYKPKHENDPMRYNGRCMNRGGIDVKSIPYTEEKEPEKSCDTCSQSRGNSGLCVVDFNCKENDYLYHTSIKKVEKEPKTKKVAVIWFGEVSEDAVKCQLYFDNKHDELTQNPEQDVELIDIERLRYGKPKKGEMLLGAVRGDIIECASNPNDAHRLIIDPTPEPETVDIELAGSRSALNGFLKRLEELKEKSKDVDIIIKL